MDLDSLIANKGEKVRPKFNALVAWFRRAYQHRAGAGVRSRQGPDGQTFIADAGTAPSFAGSWKVRLSNLQASVGSGLVGDRVPTIDGVPVDGIDPAGKVVKVPPVKITGPGEGLRSWIALRAQIDPATNELLDEEGLKIEHVTSLTSRDSSIAYEPLAMLVWQGTRAIRSVHQIAYFDLKHRFIAAKDGKAARHVFWT